jgi:glycerol-3-phosphate dehydrogenase (NAD(P)+)
LEDSLKKVGIIGGGCYGTALAACFARVVGSVWVVEKNPQIVASVNKDHKNTVSLPDIDLSKNIFYTDNADDLKDSEIIFIVVPANFINSVCDQIKNFSAPVVICSKGFDLENGRLLSDLVASQLSNDVFVLAGPSFAAEIAKGLPAKVNLAGKNFNKCSEIAQKLSSESFKIEPISDMVGLQIAAALKNVLAIGCGILYGKNLGQSASARFIVDGIQEMTEISKSLGGCAETFSKVGALGDIILTCTSLQSRNMSFGKFLAEGGSLETWYGALAEGIFAAKFIPNLRCSIKIFRKIYQIIYGHITVNEFLESVLG